MITVAIKREHTATNCRLTTQLRDCNHMEVKAESSPKLQNVPERFTYSDLSESTGDFCDASILGKGGFGVVYKGTLKSGSQVAIKRMNDATRSRGIKEFKSEVAIISQVSHRNLNKLQGYCDDLGEYMLVYDLMLNGSLDDVLFETTEGTSSLSWTQKVKILEGTAEGLDYLHRGLAQQVIHRDIKCSNILLDSEWNAKVGDFGIARLVDHQGRPATTEMAGTMGYIAPEVFTEQRFSDKADVFAFGVVSLELACGRRALPGPGKGMGLVQWVRCAHELGRLLSTVDRRQGESDAKQTEMVLKVGLLCTQLSPRNLPSMRVVLQMLTGVVKVPGILSPAERILKACSAMFKREEHLERLAQFKREEKLERNRAPKRELANKNEWVRAAANELENKNEEEQRRGLENVNKEVRMRAAARELQNKEEKWKRVVESYQGEKEERMRAAARKMEVKKEERRRVVVIEKVGKWKRVAEKEEEELRRVVEKEKKDEERRRVVVIEKVGKWRRVAEKEEEELRRVVEEEKKEEQRRRVVEKEKKEEERRTVVEKEKKEEEWRTVVEKEKKEEEQRTVMEKERRRVVEKEKKEDERRTAVENEKKEEDRRRVVEKEKKEEERRTAVEKEKKEEERRRVVEKEKKEEERRRVVEKEKKEEQQRSVMEKEEKQRRVMEKEKKKEEWRREVENEWKEWRRVVKDQKEEERRREAETEKEEEQDKGYSVRAREEEEAAGGDDCELRIWRRKGT